MAGDYSDDYGIVPFVDPSYFSTAGAAPSAAAAKPSFLSSSWNDIEKFFGINGKTTANIAGMNDPQAKTAGAAATIQNMGILTGILGSTSQAIGSFYAAKTQQYQEKSAASSYNFQADMAAINSRQAEYAAQSTLQAGQSQVQQYTMAAGQQKAEATASMAAHGVTLGVGSAQDVSASQDLIKDMDVLTINSNATKQAWAQRQQATNFSNQSMLDRVSAQNATAGAASIHPFGSAATSLIGSAGQFASQWDYRRKLQLSLGANAPLNFGFGGAYSSIGSGN